jgi:hypothetical protein
VNIESLGIPKKLLYPALVVVAAAAMVLILPITVGRTISVPGKVLPAREWLLAKAQAGSVTATLRDHLQGTVESYTVVSVLRGDAFGFNLFSTHKPGDIIGVGDTIVSIRSHELLREYHRISGELAVARANLAVMATGEKEPVTREAERSVRLARENANLQKILLQRQDSLYRRSLASREEYDLAASAAEQATIEVAIAEARLQTVRTGSKPELIRMVQSQISASEQELQAVGEQLGALTLVSPIAGVLFASTGADTLCTIYDTASVALIAVPAEYADRVAPGQQVTFRAPARPETYTGNVVAVNRQVRTLLARQSVLATATLDGSARRLPTNLVMAGVIETERVSLARHLQYWAADAWNEVVGVATGI